MKDEMKLQDRCGTIWTVKRVNYNGDMFVENEDGDTKVIYLEDCGFYEMLN